MALNSLAGLPVLLERGIDGHVTVDGIRIVLSDKLATNGIIHVIEEVILPPSSASVSDHLASAPHLSSLLEAAGLDEAAIAKLHNATFFLPTEQALEELGEEAREALVKDAKALEQVLLHHVVVGEEGSKCRGGELETAAGSRLRVTHHRHWLAPPVTLVQCARVQATTQVGSAPPLQPPPGVRGGGGGHRPPAGPARRGSHGGFEQQPQAVRQAAGGRWP